MKNETIVLEAFFAWVGTRKKWNVHFGHFNFKNTMALLCLAIYLSFSYLLARADIRDFL